MKNILKTIACAAIVSVAASCEISEFTPNDLGEGMVVSNATNIQMALNTFYVSRFPSLTEAYSSEGGSDYAIATSLGNRFTAGYDSKSETEFGGWGTIRDINYFLSLMESDACGVYGAEKANFVAQGRFFRALKYFELVMQYGDVPYFDHVITAVSNDEFKDRDSRDYVMLKINEDLDYAMANITAESKDATAVTKYVAAFVKMRANLYEASFRKYNDVKASVLGKSFSNYTVEDLYAEAASAAKFIMDSGKFSLASSYRALFTSKALDTKEVILGAATSATVMGSQNTYYNNKNQKSLVRNFINTYLMKDGTPYTAKSGYATETFATEFADRDPRLAAIVRTPGYKYSGKVVVPSIADLSAPLGYQIIKFCVDECPDGANDTKGGSNSNCVPIYRYAEVLLAYAEAQAELGKLSDADWAATVGAVRKRAGITGGLATKPSSVDNYLKTNFFPDVTDATIMEIRRERACELCLEGQRTNDLLRWGCGELLAKAEWTGINFPALDRPFDADGDGEADYYFTVSKAADEYKDIAVIVDGSTGITSVPNGSVQQLVFDIPANNRYWAADGHLALRALPYSEIDLYTKNGKTLTQNPGY